MYRDPRFFQHFSPFARPDGKPPSWWQKIIAVLVSVLVFGLVLMASVVLFAVVISVGVVAWGYVWWKTRKLRRDMAAQAQQAADSGGATRMIIEGEVIRVVDTDDSEDPAQR